MSDLIYRNNSWYNAMYRIYVSTWSGLKCHRPRSWPISLDYLASSWKSITSHTIYRPRKWTIYIYKHQKIKMDNFLVIMPLLFIGVVPVFIRCGIHFCNMNLKVHDMTVSGNTTDSIKAHWSIHLLYVNVCSCFVSVFQENKTEDMI